MTEERKRIYASGDVIKLQSEITEVDKPEFQDISEDQLMFLFKDLIPKEVISGEMEEEIVLPEFLNFSIYGSEWYRDKFPGFADEHYELMAKAAAIENAEEEKLELADELETKLSLEVERLD
jgi:hypothetical protein